MYGAGDMVRSNWVVSDLHGAMECMRALQIYMLNLEVVKEEQSIALSKRNELEEAVLIANAQHRDTQRVVTELEARIEALQVQQRVDWAEVQHSAEEFQSWRDVLEKELLNKIDVLKDEFENVQARNTFLEDRVTALGELERAVI